MIAKLSPRSAISGATANVMHRAVGVKTFLNTLSGVSARMPSA
jgi:hypothetical protein